MYFGALSFYYDGLKLNIFSCFILIKYSRSLFNLLKKLKKVYCINYLWTLGKKFIKSKKLIKRAVRLLGIKKLLLKLVNVFYLILKQIYFYLKKLKD